MHAWQKIRDWVNLTIIFISIQMIFTKPRLQINIYGDNHCGLTNSTDDLSIIGLLYFYFKLRSNQWIKKFNLNWTGNVLEIFLSERTPLFNWYNGKTTRIIDQDGTCIAEGFIISCPTVIQPFALEGIIAETIITINTYDQVKKMLSLKKGVWKIELKSGSIIYTDRLHQILKILKLLDNECKVFEFFHPTKVLIHKFPVI